MPYLTITAKVVNAKTGAMLMTDLLPHINLIDNFHYARNIALPGPIGDRYDVTFHVAPPAGLALSFHNDCARNTATTCSRKRRSNTAA